MKTPKLILSAFILTTLVFSNFAYAKGSKKQISGQLNLNTASVEQLDQLPGVSPKKAEAIADYRKEHPFKSVSDLDNVKGFSEKSIEKLKPYVSTEGGNSLAVEGGKSKKGKTQASGKKTKSKDA